MGFHKQNSIDDLQEAPGGDSIVIWPKHWTRTGEIHLLHLGLEADSMMWHGPWQNSRCFLRCELFQHFNVYKNVKTFVFQGFAAPRVQKTILATAQKEVICAPWLPLCVLLFGDRVIQEGRLNVTPIDNGRQKQIHLPSHFWKKTYGRINFVRPTRHSVTLWLIWANMETKKENQKGNYLKQLARHQPFSEFTSFR